MFGTVVLTYFTQHAFPGAFASASVLGGQSYSWEMTTCILPQSPAMNAECRAVVPRL